MTNHVIVTNGPRIESFFPSLQDHKFENDPMFEDDKDADVCKETQQASHYGQHSKHKTSFKQNGTFQKR